MLRLRFKEIREILHGEIHEIYLTAASTQERRYDQDLDDISSSEDNGVETDIRVICFRSVLQITYICNPYTFILNKISKHQLNKCIVLYRPIQINNAILSRLHRSSVLLHSNTIDLLRISNLLLVVISIDSHNVV